MSRRVVDQKKMVPMCYTLAEFCATHRIGMSTYYRLRDAGLAPEEFHPLGEKKVLITMEAAARWRAARDAEAKPAVKAVKAVKR